jgi:hypothetical protein
MLGMLRASDTKINQIVLVLVVVLVLDRQGCRDFSGRVQGIPQTPSRIGPSCTRQIKIEEEDDDEEDDF